MLLAAGPMSHPRGRRCKYGHGMCCLVLQHQMSHECRRLQQLGVGDTAGARRVWRLECAPARRCPPPSPISPRVRMRKRAPTLRSLASALPVNTDEVNFRTLRRPLVTSTCSLQSHPTFCTQARARERRPQRTGSAAWQPRQGAADTAGRKNGGPHPRLGSPRHGAPRANGRKIRRRALGPAAG